MLSPALTNKLICAKYIFLQGKEILEKGSPYSEGLAILAFQDSLEMVLRIIIEHLNFPLKDNAQFSALLEALEKQRTITHKTALLQINKARVNFKHYGLEPKKEDVNKFKSDLDTFFPNALQSFLQIDFDSLSLATLIRHQRTSNWLMKAERFLQDEKYTDSIECSAKAFELYWNHFYEQNNRRNNSYLTNNIRKLANIRSVSEVNDTIKGLVQVVEDSEKQFKLLHDELNIIAHGIILHEYRKFKYYSPEISISGAQTFHVSPCINADKHDYQVASYCYKFSLDALFKIQNSDIFNYRKTTFPNIFYIAKSASPILVCPRDAEIIRQSEVGERFQAYCDETKHKETGYAAIVVDNDLAYIREESLDKIV